MFAEGIFPIGDGMLDIDEERLKALLVPHDINDIYEIEQTPFARGKFAAVRRAIHKNSGTHFAAKFLKRRRRAQSSDKEIKHEIAVLMLCNDAENIVKLNAVHESRSDTALLLELATGGELQTFLDNEECLNEGQARICMREVLKALQYLHKRSIVHLDLKPQNILLTGERIEDGLKLCDFGISRVVAEGTNVREIVGTPDYVAPEVLNYEPLSLCTDIWSVGVLAYVLLSGFSPFGGETKQETFLNISQCALTFPDKLFGGVSTAAIDFIRKALRIKPNDRMTAAGCLEHIWLKDECNIDRHIFNSITTKQQLEHGDNNHEIDDNDEEDEDEIEQVEDDDEEDDEVDEDEVVKVDDEDDEVEIQAITVDNSEDDDNFTSTSTNGHSNGHLHVFTNGHSNGYDCDHSAAGNSIQFANGHSELSKGHSNGFTKTLCEDLNDKATKLSNASSKHQQQSTISATTKTTAVHNVAAIKAINIPLCSVQPTSSQQIPPQEQQQQHQQQHLIHIPARRHSSESNKENTFLTTKKIQPSTTTNSHNNNNNSLTTLKKHSSATVTQSNTATIVITPSACTNASNIVATITLPCSATTASSNSDNKLVNHSFFPDAPTTPKVIRKASPNSDPSPTSVKALVKKFQLEGGEQPITPPEFATNGSKHHQQQQHQLQPSHITCLETNKTKYIKGRPSVSPPTLAHSSALTIANSARRASEPITAIHTTKKLSITSSSAPVAIPLPTTNNFKTTCVYCKSCTNSLATSTSTNGCRHPSSCSTSNPTSAAATLVHKQSTSPSTTALLTSSTSTKSLLNGSTSNGSLTSSGTSTSNGTTATNTSAATALLFGQHHHLLNPHHSHHHSHHHHHHHLHHHGVVKSAAAPANGLSLDQGIIC